MADLFGGLGGLMKGLSSFMPADDPNAQLFKRQTELSDLRKQESELYAEIGKTAVAQYGIDAFGELSDRLKLTQANLSAAEQKFKEAESAKTQQEQAEKAALAERTCPECGYENPEGTKFCQDCGAKLGMASNLCPSCGHGNPAGVKFCQECGAKLAAGGNVCGACGQENPPGTRFCGSCGGRLEG